MSDVAPAPTPLPPRRRRRWPWIVLAVLAALVVAILAVVAWIFSTSHGARLVLGQATRMAGDGVKMEGVEGRIGGVLHIARIEVSRPDLYALVQDVELDTAPWSPLQGTLVVHRLSARSVEVRTASSAATARMPVSFAPPYPIRLEEGRVGELRKGTLTREAAAEKDPKRKRELMDATRGADLLVRDVYLKGTGSRTAWTIDEARAATAYGAGRVAGRLDAAPPFGIDMKAALEGRVAERDYRADVAATGSLKALEVDAKGVVSGQPATAHAALEPFASFPLRALRVHAEGVDLARQANGPESRLTVDVNLTGAAEANAFAGPVRIDNALAGRWDAKRLPFTSAAARVVVTRERVDVADLHLALLGGGGATGRASLTKDGVEADLRVADVDLAALQGTLQKTRMTGRIVASGDRAAQRFEVALKDPRFAIDGRGRLGGEKLDVETARITTGGGAITATGDMALAGSKAFRFQGRAEHFDPSAFVKTTRGDLNFAFDATGTLAGAPAGEVRLDIAPSTYAGLPAAGRVHVAGDAKRVARADVDVTLAEAHFTAKGAFGAPGDAMDVAFQVPNLAAVAKPFGVVAAGRVQGQGRLTGTFQSPAGRIALDGANLALPANVAVRELSLRAEAGVDPRSAIDVSVKAKGVAYGKEVPPPPFAQSVDASLKGTRAAHRLELAAVMNEETTVRMALQGGLDPAAKQATWAGRIEQLAMTGRGAFSLQSPATLQASAERVEVGDARLKGEWGEAHFITTRWTPRSLDFKGTSPGIEIRNLARSLRLGPAPLSDLVVAVDWDVHGAESLDGTVSLRRVSGDLRVGEPALPLGLQSLALEARVVHGRATATAQLAGDRVGRLEGRGSALLVRGTKGWSLAPDAPIDARIVAEHTNMEALSPWLGVDAKLAGHVNAVVTVSGTGADPRVGGELHAQDLAVREPQSGFEVHDGQVAVRLAGKSITIERFTASTPWHPANAAKEKLQRADMPATGTLQAEGSIDLGARTGALRLRADHAVVTQTPGRFVAISGEATVQANADGMLAKGAFTADAGWVGALDTPLPTVAEDVVVVRASEPAKPEAKKDSQPLRVDLTVGLGRNAWFDGRGLDTRLAGEIKIAGQVGGDLRATGTIRTVGGTYKGYGQNLAIERGVLQFAGPLDNPRLNVLAVRKGLAVEPGVEVLGTATRPKVRLVSTPEVPDSEKLSWLVLGRGPSELAPGDASVLLAAATSMLGGNNPGSDLGKKFGLDEVRIGHSDSGNILGVMPQSTVAGRTGTPSAAEVVTVGKRLGKDVNLSYEQGLAATEGALRVAWQISRPFQVLVRAGYLPGLDAVYRWTFR